MSDSEPHISIVVPTYREAANLRPLALRVAASLGAADHGACTGQRPVPHLTGETPVPHPSRSDRSTSYELIISDDDSRDGTAEIVAELAAEHPLRLITRTEKRDLSLAVVDGLRAARGEYLVVMDADLSHPPEQIPELVAPLRDGRADFVVGSRYVTGGTTQNWGGGRRVNSYVATALAWPLNCGVRDVMSGFFALRRETFEQARGLRPLGYKIGLELLWRCGISRPLEIPIRFQDRTKGESKLSLEQQARYLIHLDRLYSDYRRGWGMLLRPVLWSMLGAIRTAQFIRSRRG